MANQYVVVAEADSLPPGKGRTVEVRGRRFALWNVEGEFHALDDACPHRGAPLGAGILDQGQVYCPMHGWAFDPKTGACSSNPARPVRRHPTKVEDGKVWVDLAAEVNPEMGDGEEQVADGNRPIQNGAGHES